MDYYLRIIASSAIIYLFIIVAIRLLGKKEFAQLSVTDLVFVLLISNAVQNAMVGSDNTVLGGITAASTLFIVNALFKNLLYRFPKLQNFVEGEGKLLIYKGKVKEENLKSTRISINELLETVREHGVKSIDDVDLAILESDGNISVLSDNYHKHTLHLRKRRKKLL
ncbi:MAG TPA: YetF domain-containing protein, partial [Saprospiraceae bacterium]|nr:YetF domain-containing protein [Saprospiraceae bacterium]